MHLLERADAILVLHEGIALGRGSYQDLAATSIEFQLLLGETASQAAAVKRKETGSSISPYTSTSTVLAVLPGSSNVLHQQREVVDGQECTSGMGQEEQERYEGEPGEDGTDSDCRETLLQPRAVGVKKAAKQKDPSGGADRFDEAKDLEFRASGQIGTSVYMAYFRAAGSLVFIHENLSQTFSYFMSNPDLRLVPALLSTL